MPQTIRGFSTKRGLISSTQPRTNSTTCSTTLLQEMPEDGLLASIQTAPARHWLGIMRRVALATFDRLAPVPLQDAEKAKTIVNAYGILNATFAGWTKQSKSLYDKLELPLPEKKSKTKKETA